MWVLGSDWRMAYLCLMQEKGFFLAALRRVAINLTLSCLNKKPNKPKKGKDPKLQQRTTKSCRPS